MEAKTVATPGELLRGARQLYGWSVEEVAVELNLLPYIIQALENDDYDQLAGWTYVVGYLRSYGKLVSVNVESAIKQHENIFTTHSRWTGYRHRKYHPSAANCDSLSLGSYCRRVDRCCRRTLWCLFKEIR